MIKAIYGKITFNRHDCPSCENSLLNKSQWFFCDVCGYCNEDEKATKFKIIVPPPGIRSLPPRELQEKLLQEQNGECYWCNEWSGSVDHHKKYVRGYQEAINVVRKLRAIQ